MTQRYRLARKSDRIPMPGRGPGVFFSAEKEGESLDPTNPWHARLIDDGSVVPVEDEPEAPQAKPQNGAK